MSYSSLTACTTTEILPPEKSSLAELAAQANAAHEAAGTALSAAVDHALVAGRALIAAKQQVPEGGWTRWVQRNCGFSIRHAQRYIKLVVASAADATRVSRDVEGLSLRKAMKQLTPPKPKAVGKPGRIVKSNKTPTALDIVEVWDAAPVAERTRAVNNIGLTQLLEALPVDWWPLIERASVKRAVAKHARPAASVPIETGPDGCRGPALLQGAHS